MNSIKEIYKIGYGPSSSHTMGPGYAAERFLKRNPQAETFEVELYGALAMTGSGHMTDAILERVLGKSRTKIIFNKQINYDYHPNGMKFKAFCKGELLDEWLVFSVGGGDLKELGEERNHFNHEVYPHQHFDEILKYCEINQMTLVEYARHFEDDDLDSYLERVLTAMKKCVHKGLQTEGTLPGRMKIIRKAPSFYQKYLKSPSQSLLVYTYALAVSEENASAGEVVTAPTCGASAVVPAILLSQEVLANRSKEALINALIIGGLIANVVKTNASISGAEVGCQGEVGVACSMASGMLAYLFGVSNQVIEYAAEIALEHHLGLTCDPVDGLVQIPCIERNALAAQTAYNVAEYAMITGGIHSVTFDSVVEVMKETGIDLSQKYKETSTGGLALRNSR